MIDKLKEGIKQHQLGAFFLLTYLITWLLILPYILTGDEQTFGIFVLIGIFGPEFINIIISRIIEPVLDEKLIKKKQVTFLVTWIIATAIFTSNVITTSDIESPVAIIFYAIVGLLPAFILASVFSKFPGVRKSLSSLLKPKGHVWYYVFAHLFAPIDKLVSIPITNLLGMEVISEPDQVCDLLESVVLISISFYTDLSSLAV